MLKKFLWYFFAVVILISVMPVTVFAKEITSGGNLWVGDELKVDVVAGTEGYTYMSCSVNL